jgi:hypothetical protein
LTGPIDPANIQSFPLSFFAGITTPTAPDLSPVSVEFSDPWLFTVYDASGNVVPDLFFDSQGGLQYNVTDGVNPNAAAVPEPPSWTLLLFGCGALVVLRWQRLAIAA